MIPQDANVPEFAQLLSSQAKEAFSPDIPEKVREAITSIIYEFINIAGRELNNDQENTYNMQQTQIICQLVGEWMFHKGIDNFKNEIPEEFWKPILQQITFAVYETARRDILGGADLDTIINNAENAVNSTYANMITQLEQTNRLKKTKEEILNQSNLNDYVEENHSKEEGLSEEQEEMEKRYMTLALYLKNFPPEKVAKLVKNLNTEEKGHIMTYIRMNDLEQRVDPILYNQYLEKFHNSLPKVQEKKSKQILMNKLNKAFSDIEEENLLQYFSCERQNVKNFIIAAYSGKILEGGEDSTVFSPELRDVIVDYIAQCDFSS